LTVTEFIGLKICRSCCRRRRCLYWPGQHGVNGALGNCGRRAALFAPNLYVGYSAKKRVKSFNNQLAMVSRLMANSLRSGYSFLQSMDLVSREATCALIE